MSVGLKMLIYPIIADTGVGPASMQAVANAMTKYTRFALRDTRISPPTSACFGNVKSAEKAPYPNFVDMNKSYPTSPCCMSTANVRLHQR